MGTPDLRRCSIAILSIAAMSCSAGWTFPSGPADLNATLQEGLVQQGLIKQGLELFQAARYPEAEAVLSAVIKAWPPTSETSTVGLEAALHNLAAVYRMEGRIGEAIPLYRRAIALREARAGANDFSMLLPLNGLALAYLDTRDPRSAEKVLNRAVSIASLHRSESTLDAGHAFGALGGILLQSGRYGQAREWLLRALDVYQNLHDERDSALMLIRLGRVLAKMGRRAEARTVLDRAVSESRLLPDPADLAAALSGLAELLTAERQYASAYASLEQARAVLDQDGSSADTDLGIVLVRMAEIRAMQRRPEDAAVLYRQGLETLENSGRGATADMLPVLKGYARSLRAVEDYATAAKVDSDGMRILTKSILASQPRP